LEGIGEQVAANNKRAAVAQRERRARIQIEIAMRVQGATPEQATQEWWKHPEATLRDWANDYLATSKEHFCLPDDSALWPDPAKLPTIRAIIASHLVRIYMQLVEHRRVSEGDDHDSHHYAASAYVDVFVTEDSALLATLAKIPNTQVKVLTFNDFAAMMSVEPH
jgi:hypothetical protein